MLVHAFPRSSEPLCTFPLERSTQDEPSATQVLYSSLVDTSSPNRSISSKDNIGYPSKSFFIHFDLRVEVLYLNIAVETGDISSWMLLDSGSGFPVTKPESAKTPLLSRNWAWRLDGPAYLAMEVPILNSENRMALPRRHCLLSDPLPPKILSHFTVCRPSTSTESSPVCPRERVFPDESPLPKKYDSAVSLSPRSTDLNTTVFCEPLPSQILPPPRLSPAADTCKDAFVRLRHEDRRHEQRHDELKLIPCEFDRDSCPTGAKNPRKCISHFFGRNKTCTKGFPAWVWVYYCRKHYQRARYRSDSWPFKQCDIFQETLDRMESWGGVLSFRLTLRRREHRRSPSVDYSTPVNGRQTDLATTSPSLSSPNISSSKPKDHTVPVPSWLRAEVGANKTFQDIRDIIERIRQYMQTLRDAYRPVAFPDIEILPTFRAAVLEDGGSEDDEGDDDEDSDQSSTLYSTNNTNGSLGNKKRKSTSTQGGQSKRRR